MISIYLSSGQSSKLYKKIVDEKTNQQLNRFSNIYFNKVKKDTIINEL